ncbi:MAG: DUF1385 domain-containing protein, partial [Polyangiaceae bacterium]
MSQPVSARPYIGGQAVLEGVMMRAPNSFAVVLRRQDGSLIVRERAVTDTRTGWAKLPLLRGMHSLVESLKLGSEALRFSGEQMEKDFAAQAAQVTTALGMSLFALATSDGEGSIDRGASPGGEAKPSKG